jgi:hypothetical protein
MSAMEPATTNQPTRDYPRTPDGKYKYTAWDGSPRYLEPSSVPGLVGEDFPIPQSVIKFFRKLFRRKDTPAVR